MKKASLLLIILFCFIDLTAQTWVQRASYSGQGRVNPVSFTINGKGYLAIGSSLDTPNSPKFNDVWEYNTLNNTWIQKANVPGAGRTGGIGVVNSGFGYVGLGWDGTTSFKDIHEFNPSNNSWLLETTYPGQGSRNCFAAVNNGDLYVAGGLNSNSTTSDFWKYNFSSGLWTQMPSFVLGNRQGGICFSIDSIVFFGMGYNGNSNFNDLWGYNVNTGLWSQYNSFPGTGRIQSSVNLIGKKAIIGGGHQIGVGNRLSDYYEFDYLSNSWRSVSGFIAGSRSASTGFSIGNRTFLSSGKDSIGNSLNDLWEITGLITSLDENETITHFSIHPNPASDILNLSIEELSTFNVKIFDKKGTIIYQSFKHLSNSTIDVSDFENGLYTVVVYNNEENLTTKSFIKIK